MTLVFRTVSPLATLLLASCSLLALPGARAATPSFDCAKAAAHSASALVCQHDDLAAQDRELNELYSKALQLAPQVADLRHAQRHWLHRRDACTRGTHTSALDCIRDAYQQRITTLQAQMYPAPVPDAAPALPAMDGLCGTDWNRHIESLVHTGDGAAHGPDWGSEEWQSVVEFRLGLRDKPGTPAHNDPAWCRYIEQHLGRLQPTRR